MIKGLCKADVTYTDKSLPTRFDKTAQSDTSMLVASHGERGIRFVTIHNPADYPTFKNINMYCLDFSLLS